MIAEWIEGANFPHLLPPAPEGAKGYRWVRWGGYEVSTHGDRRFSAFCAYMPDGRSLESHYQCDLKGYSPGSDNWRLGKGKPPRDPSVDLWPGYLALWDLWASRNSLLIDVLRKAADDHGGLLSDRFASTPINQAHALAVILNRVGGPSARAAHEGAAPAAMVQPSRSRPAATARRKQERSSVATPQPHLF